MKSIKSLPSFAALALCLSVSSMASAATITPVNSAFTAPGTISVSSPASLNLPVTCNITFKGTTAADGSYASIDSVTVGSSTPVQRAADDRPAVEADRLQHHRRQGRWRRLQDSLLYLWPEHRQRFLEQRHHIPSAPAISRWLGTAINSLSVQPTPAFVVNP